MDFKSTIDLIIKDLNEASEIIDDLKKYPGVPALQVEFAKSKCKSAATVIELLKNLNDIVPVKEAPVAEKTVSLPLPENAKPVPEPRSEKSMSDNQVVAAEEKRPETKKSDVPHPQVKEKKKEVITPEKQPVSSVADKFSPHSDLYEEQAAKIKADMDLSDRLKKKPITNLSEAIGLNDRFLFISEIFEGDKDSYAQAISRLDKAESLQDAMAIIMSYTGEKPENEAVIQLLDLVRLKLPANE